MRSLTKKLPYLLLGAVPFTVQASQNILGIETTTSTVNPTSDVLSTADPKSSGVNGITTINTTFNNQVKTVTSIQTAAGTYIPIGNSLDAKFRRSSDDNTVLYWSAGSAFSGSGSTRSITLYGSPTATMEEAFSSQNLFIGTDNLFVNSGHTGGNQNNIERVDFYNPAAMTASADLGFAIFERGGNDPFKIAIITSLDGAGNPNGYSSVYSSEFSSSNRGNILDTFDYLVIRDGAASDKSSQSIYGKLFTMEDFGIANGTQIYGYSIFAADVTGEGDQLVDWTDTTYFPETLDNNATTGAPNRGGLDLLAYGGFMQFQPVPEPSSLLLLGASLGFAFRRRR
ncbi:MAG: PEP-CTERM sorting domain-containing protein [Luteolibacter sp.]